MAIEKTFADFVIGVKRKCNYGDEGTTSDQATADVIRLANEHRKSVARRNMWECLIKTFTISIVSGTQDYTLDTTIEKVLAIGDNNSDYLRKVSIKEALQWHTPDASVSDEETVLGYWAPMGRTDAGALKIKIFGNPSASATLTGYGLKVVSALALADIAAGTLMTPFSDDITNIIDKLVCADVKLIQGKAPEAAMFKSDAESDLTRAISDNESDPADDVTSATPDYYRRKSILRKAGYVC